MAAAVIGAAWFSAGHVARHLRASAEHSPPWRALPVLQVAVFLGMEASERIAARVPVETLADNLALGLTAQVVVAALLALGMHLLGRTAAAIGRVLMARPRQPRGASFVLSPLAGPVTRLAVVPCGSRGPPLS